MSVYGLGVISLGTDALPITKLAERDPSGAVRIAALDALGRYEAAKNLGSRESGAAASIAFAMASDADPIVRGRAAISLSFFADGPAARASLAALMRAMRADRSDAVRERIMWTVFRRYAAAAPLEFLNTYLHDRDEVVRIEAVRAYGKLHDAHLAAVLRPLRTDPSWRVAEQAGESIRLLEGEKPTDHLTSIPHNVRTPSPQADPLAGLPAITSPAPSKPAAPNSSEAIFQPQIDPHTARDMTGPAPGPHPRVRIVTTKGNVYLVLYPEWAPVTTLNFLNLARNGFFSNNPWFRIVPDFVVQTGEQDAKNSPGPGYTIRAEENPLEQNSGVLSMGLNYDQKTNTPLRDSAGSEYYVTLSPQYHLDNDFTVFGSVSSGFSVLGRLVESDKVVRIERIADVTL
jgi:cyclophilin family peptidyl-prolyl cis-trans isomerase